MNVTTNLLWEVLARALPYRETWRRRIKRQQPVNVSELQSFLVEARRVANSTPSRRYLAGADSQVALGAVVKGRAAAQKLNTTMQTTLPYVLGGDIFSLPMCFFTSSRRGDAPTGDADLPELDLALPSWFEPLQIGRFDTNDRWMEQGAP